MPPIRLTTVRPGLPPRGPVVFKRMPGMRFGALDTSWSIDILGEWSEPIQDKRVLVVSCGLSELPHAPPYPRLVQYRSPRVIELQDACGGAVLFPFEDLGWETLTAYFPARGTPWLFVNGEPVPPAFAPGKTGTVWFPSLEPEDLALVGDINISRVAVWGPERDLDALPAQTAEALPGEAGLCALVDFGTAPPLLLGEEPPEALLSMGAAVQRLTPSAHFIDGWIDCGELTEFIADGFAVECWFWPETSREDTVLLSSGITASWPVKDLFGVALGVPTGGRVLGTIFIGGQELTLNAPFAMQAWNHVAFAWDRSTETLSAYVNGFEARRGRVALSPNPAARRRVRIGADVQAPYLLQRFNGYVQELRLWRGARSAHEIVADLDALPLADREIIAYWSWGFPNAAGADWSLQQAAIACHGNVIEPAVQVDAQAQMEITSQALRSPGVLAEQIAIKGIDLEASYFEGAPFPTSVSRGVDPLHEFAGWIGEKATDILLPAQGVPDTASRAGQVLIARAAQRPEIGKSLLALLAEAGTFAELIIAFGQSLAGFAAATARGESGMTPITMAVQGNGVVGAAQASGAIGHGGSRKRLARAQPQFDAAKRTRPEDRHTTNERLEVTMFRVGHGDSLLVQYQRIDPSSSEQLEPWSMLVDGGPRARYLPPIRRRLEMLKSLNVMCATHPDADHVVGLIGLLENPPCVVRTLVTNHPSAGVIPPELWHATFDGDGQVRPEVLALGEEADDPRWELHSYVQVGELIRKARALGIHVTSQFVQGQMLAIPPPAPLTLDTTGPWPWSLQRYQLTSKHPNAEQANRISITFDINSNLNPHGAPRYLLLTADAYDLDVPDNATPVVLEPPDAKKTDLRGPVQPRSGQRYHLLKVPHHGSRNTDDATFYQAYTADNYLISSNGHYGLPALDTLLAIVDSNQNRPFSIYLTHETETLRELIRLKPPQQNGYHAYVLRDNVAEMTFTITSMCVVPPSPMHVREVNQASIAGTSRVARATAERIRSIASI